MVKKKNYNYELLVQSIPDIIFEINAKGEFIFINRVVEELGYKPEELIGRSLLYIVQPGDHPFISRELKAASFKKMTGRKKKEKGNDNFGEKYKNLEVRLMSRVIPGGIRAAKRAGKNNSDGPSGLSDYKREECICEMSLAPVWSVGSEKGQGAFLGAAGIIRDISRQKEAEEQVKLSLKEKDVLLKEVHHRVKNNLQIISSIFDLSSLRTNDKKALSLFQDAISKIETMSLLHSQIYRSERFDQLNIADHIKEILDYLRQFLDVPKSLKWDITIKERINLTIEQAIPLTLVITELISNSMKHAFPGNQRGRIGISLKKNENNFLTMSIKDNGRGIPESIDPVKTQSLGLKLVRNLVRDQLRGSLDFRTNKGTEIILSFRIYGPGERG